ncbi:LPXTG cell wall anchor domain-containing protein [Vagococcus carniphilus]|uniref:LPXTG cell wall anchor domain-containing protein n=1 Tax=Vagococcus carniphilus TaxID=218144 RepID=UPI003B5906D2
MNQLGFKTHFLIVSEKLAQNSNYVDSKVGIQFKDTSSKSSVFEKVLPATGEILMSYWVIIILCAITFFLFFILIRFKKRRSGN